MSTESRFFIDRPFKLGGPLETGEDLPRAIEVDTKCGRDVFQIADIVRVSDCGISTMVYLRGCSEPVEVQIAYAQFKKFLDYRPVEVPVS